MRVCRMKKRCKNVFFYEGFKWCSISVWIAFELEKTHTQKAHLHNRSGHRFDVRFYYYTVWFFRAPFVLQKVHLSFCRLYALFAGGFAQSLFNLGVDSLCLGVVVAFQLAFAPVFHLFFDTSCHRIGYLLFMQVLIVCYIKKAWNLIIVSSTLWGLRIALVWEQTTHKAHTWYELPLSLCHKAKRARNATRAEYPYPARAFTVAVSCIHRKLRSFITSEQSVNKRYFMYIRRNRVFPVLRPQRYNKFLTYTSRVSFLCYIPPIYTLCKNVHHNTVYGNECCG